MLTFRDESTGKDAPVRAIQFTAQPGAVAAAAGGENTLSFGEALLFALLGGLILNLMPCVFPVLSMKALALVRGGQGDPRIAAPTRLPTRPACLRPSP